MTRLAPCGIRPAQKTRRRACADGGREEKRRPTLCLATWYHHTREDGTWGFDMRISHAVLAVAVCGVAGGLLGCAAGRGPAGEVVVGLDVAKLPETATELAATAAGLIPGPWGKLIETGVLAVGAGALAHQRARHVGWDEAEQARRQRERDKLLALSNPAVAASVIHSDPIPADGPPKV